MSPCEAPLPDEALVDWWAGERLPDRRGVEEHLLGCDGCSSRVERLQRMAEGIADLLRRGELPVVVTPAVVDRFRREGLRVREYAVAAGTGVQCTVAPQDDLLLARLGADLRSVSRLDLVSRIDEGAELRLVALPFDPRSGELLLIPPVALIRARPSAFVERVSLLAVSAEGERVIGRYAFHHTPWAGE